MATIGAVSGGPSAVTFSEDRYWDLVKETLEKIYKKPSAADDADDLRHDVAQSSQEEQTIFYHAEPLDVAADIVGQAPSIDDVLQYQDLVRDRFATWGIRTP